MERNQITANKIAAEYDQSRPDEELFTEKIQQEKQLPYLVEQLVKEGKAENKSKAIMQALDIMRAQANAGK